MRSLILPLSGCKIVTFSVNTLFLVKEEVVSTTPTMLLNKGSGNCL